MNFINVDEIDKIKLDKLEMNLALLQAQANFLNSEKENIRLRTLCKNRKTFDEGGSLDSRTGKIEIFEKEIKE